MKKLLLCILMFTAWSSGAQTYTYIPLALDTSSFWLSEFLFYDGGYVCRGERLSAVVGNTIIGGQEYSRIVTYTTKFDDPSVPLCNGGYLNQSTETFIREDTAAKKVYYDDGSIAIDFNMKVGDTLPKVQTIIPYAIIDSINIQNILGVDRRIQWAGTIRPSGFRHQSIEGIGMNYNFPVAGYGEWGIPVYRLQCYSKGGQTLWTNGSVTNCTRKPPAKLNVKKAPELSRSDYSIEGNRIHILRSELLPLNLQVYDITGKLLSTNTIKTQAAISLDLIPGSYVLRFSNREHAGAFMVQIR